MTRRRRAGALPTPVSRVVRGAAIGLAALVVLGIAGVVYVRSAEQARTGTVGLEGLDAPVDVVWTEGAVPSIWAGSLRDAVFAQGFLHARERLWQMDLVRRAVQGRLAEVMGESALSTDRFMRGIGLWRAALDGLAALDPGELEILQAYADGVNAALEHWSGALPPEFLLLRYEPEPWEPVHTLAVARMMSLTLAAYGESVGVARALRTLPEDRVQWLFPELPDWGATILPPEPPAMPSLAAALIERFSVAAASNAWVVDGSRTASGKPILANDMHLELQAPSLWYLVAIHAPASDSLPALHVEGVSLPGSPLVIVGRNRAVAWGFTNAYVDDVDLFIERVDPDDPRRYLTPEGSRPFEVTTETIDVRGQAAPVELEVRRTRHGPVLPPGDTGASGDTVLALCWTASEPTTVVRSVLGFNLARGWDELVRAVDRMDTPNQNVVYADTAGHIGFVMGGTVPIRGDHRPATALPRPGWTGEWDWTGTLPFEEHPRSLDPDLGFFATANNRQTAEPVSELISSTWLEPFRAMRIAQMIVEAPAPLDVPSTQAMQLDVLDLYAARYADRAVAAAAAAGLPTATRLLRGWDHRATGDSEAATLFYDWNERVRWELARHLYGGTAGYFTRASAATVLEQQAVPWAASPEDAYRDIVVRAMRHAAEETRGLSWEQANQVVHRHALGDIPLLNGVLGLNIGPMPHGGSPNTVNVALWVSESPEDGVPFMTTAGVSMRQVMELGNTDASGGFVIPTGQSGLPFSRHYDDLTPMWQDGGLLTLDLGPDLMEDPARNRLRLVPAAQDDRR